MASQDPVSLQNRNNPPSQDLIEGLLGGSNRNRCSISNIACTAPTVLEH